MKNIWIIIFYSCLLFLNSCQKKFLCPDCDVNQVPIARAGSDQIITLPKDTAFLNGSNSSDADGKIIFYKWRIVSGPFISTIINPDSAKTALVNLGFGTYRFELKVVDNNGAIANDTIQIIVNSRNGINMPPVAISGIDQAITLPEDSILLNGNQSFDPDGKIATYHWAKISGPSSFSISHSDAAQTMMNDLRSGVYRFELKVTDNDGLFSKDTVEIIVNDIPPPPPLAADAGVDMIITLPLDSAWINGYSSDPTVSNYKWTQVAGPSVCTFAYSNSATTCAKNLIPGLYSFRLEIQSNSSTSVDVMNLLVVDDPLEHKTITYTNLKWEYGHIFGSTTKSLFLLKPDWFDLTYRPVEVFLQLDSGPQWFKVPDTRDGITYWKDDVLGLYRLWIGISSADMSWVGKQSSIKVRIL